MMNCMVMKKLKILKLLLLLTPATSSGQNVIVKETLITVQRDTDGDGISDINDEDDDNDGILDALDTEKRNTMN